MKPEIKKFPLPFSPLEAFELIQDEENSFFLDSSLDIYGLGKYSFLGCSPFLLFKSKGKEIEVMEKGKGKEKFSGNPFNVLRKITNRYRVDTLPHQPPFIGGALGCFGYDLCHSLEKLPSYSVDDLNLPDCYLAFYDSVLIFDHEDNNYYLSSCGFSKDSGKEFEAKLISGNKRLKKETEPCDRTVIDSNFRKEDYLKAVAKAKEYIAAGDIYQVNLSQRFSTEVSLPPFELYKRLRGISPAPFASFFNLGGEAAVVSVSPERFLSLRGNKVETRPMKGTRPRGKDAREDEGLKNELLNSEKDKAELVMIVDLERNDLGKVCDYGSVKVSASRTLETYATVFQTTGTVEGVLRNGKDRVDLLKAAFPGGSITGAPKVRAMEIIDELEPTKRSFYTGSLGYLGFDGNMDLNIIIRTFLIKNGKAYFQVGGGIVVDSSPEAEYEETLHKARALMEAVKG